MMELLDSIATAYGMGFVYLFTIPAIVICGIVLFEVCDSALEAWRQRRTSDEPSWQEIGHELPQFHLDRPETALRKWHFRPLDQSLTQPFAKQPNRPVSDAYRWG